MSATTETHKVLGKRSQRVPSGTPSGEQLNRALRFNDEMHRMFPSGFRPRGKLLRFKTLEQADQYDHQCLIQAMAKKALDAEQK